MIIDRGKPCDSSASPDCWFFVTPFSTLSQALELNLCCFPSGHLSCKVPGCTCCTYPDDLVNNGSVSSQSPWLYGSIGGTTKGVRIWTVQSLTPMVCSGITPLSATPPFARKARKCGSKPYKKFWKNEKPLGREIKWHKWSGQRILYLNQSDLSYPLRILSLHPLARLRFKDWFLGSPKIDSLLLPDIRGTHEPHEL